ncbi:hypothetical protein IGI04_014032 [Brassica rapa subsp. trilocularis]|uniref:Uncharacterized protein n=1 Tax=Brassica rapa subsp. trilocularis TaxID=1813537 RepID=A0ABQ7NAI9_BRACM|nr:hypothetical protein IGI04_014032 [Brassica rapa subsp. trilocularis]
MHGLVSYRRFGRARSLCSDRTERTLARYVATELGSSSVATSVKSGLLALLKVERDKIGAAPYDGCPRTLFEGIKPFVVRLGVKVLMTSFPVRPLWSSFYVAVIRRVAADGILYGCRRKTTSCHLFSVVCKLAGFLKILEYWQRDKFWDLVSGCLILCLEMLETNALGLGQDLGLLLVLEGAMTNSTNVSRFSFILIPYRFKVRDRFSTYTTCMRYYPCVGCTRVISTRWLIFAKNIFLEDVSAYDYLVFHEGVFIEEGNFVEELIFRRLRRLAMLKICESCLGLLMECYRKDSHDTFVSGTNWSTRGGSSHHREEGVPFNVHDATSILEFSSSQMFSILFRDSLGTTETERNALKFFKRNWLSKSGKGFNTLANRRVSVRYWYRKLLNRYFEGLCTFLLLRFRMVNNPVRFKDDAWIFFLSLGSELDMRGDHFSIFKEFRSRSTRSQVGHYVAADRVARSLDT